MQTARRPRGRLARIHVVLLAAIAVLAWVALTIEVATERGERRRATFNNSASYVR